MDLQGEETIESEELPVHVLLVEDEPDLRSTLRYNLKRNGYAVTDVGNGREALTALKADGPPVEIVVSDVMMPVMDGHALVRAVRGDPASTELPFMFLTAKGETADRVEGFRLGADDYLTKPFDIEELLARVQVLARRAYTARRMRKLLPALVAGADKPGLVKQMGDLYAKVAEWERRFPQLAVIRADSIVGGSMRTMHLLREILVRAPGKDPVLISGETGTGKTGVAEALHRLGPRVDKPFRVVNCAELGAADHAITAGRLFGFGKGSGLANVAKEGQPGLLDDVDGGTLFFDEIHRLPLEAQAMLLLPIEGRPFHPAVGKGDPRTVDVKFIFATNVDLRAEAQAGRFPFDLFQRLAQSQIRVPSLSERREDIATLAAHFLDECRGEYDIQQATFAPSLLKHLVERAYEGNIRELRNIVREIARRAAFELDTVLTLEHLPEAWDKLPSAGALPEAVAEPGAAPTPVPLGTDDDGGGFWHELEMQELRSLRRHRFKIAAAEVELGLSSKSRTLTNHLRGMCFKALCKCEQGDRFDVRAAAQLVVGRADAALLDRTVERLESYLDMVEMHVAAHTVETLFNNLPRDYRKQVERAIELARARHQR